MDAYTDPNIKQSRHLSPRNTYPTTSFLFTLTPKGSYISWILIKAKSKTNQLDYKKRYLPFAVNNRSN